MKDYKYKEWFEIYEMYEHSKEWFLELSFIKNEQKFLNNLIQSFALKLINRSHFEQLVAFKNDIAISQKELILLFKQVQKHMDKLVILMNNASYDTAEKGYRKMHIMLVENIDDFLLKFRNMKQQGFDNLTILLRENKNIDLMSP